MGKLNIFTNPYHIFLIFICEQFWKILYYLPEASLLVFTDNVTKREKFALTQP